MCCCHCRTHRHSLLRTAAPPGAPRQPKLEHVSATQIIIKWEDGNDHGETVKRYRVEFTRLPAELMRQLELEKDKPKTPNPYRQPKGASVKFRPLSYAHTAAGKEEARRQKETMQRNQDKFNVAKPATAPLGKRRTKPAHTTAAAAAAADGDAEKREGDAPDATNGAHHVSNNQAEHMEAADPPAESSKDKQGDGSGLLEGQDVELDTTLYQVGDEPPRVRSMLGHTSPAPSPHTRPAPTHAFTGAPTADHSAVGRRLGVGGCR